MQELVSLEHTQPIATEWLSRYNIERSNSPIGGVAPTTILQAA